MTITGTKLCGGCDGDVWQCGSDQPSGGEQHDHYGDHTSRCNGSTGAVTVTVTNLGPQSGSLANGYTYNVSAADQLRTGGFGHAAGAYPQQR